MKRVLLLLALAACDDGANVKVAPEGATQGAGLVQEVTLPAWGGKVQVIDLKDGTRCAVYVVASGGGIDCWRP